MAIRKKVFDLYGPRCSAIRNGQRCTAVTGLHVHHLDQDVTNNSLSNLRPVCPPCHRELKDAPREAFVSAALPLIG